MWKLILKTFSDQAPLTNPSQVIEGFELCSCLASMHKATDSTPNPARKKKISQLFILSCLAGIFRVCAAFPLKE